MALRRPLVRNVTTGRLEELPVSDSLPGAGVLAGSFLVDFGPTYTDEAGFTVTGVTGITATSRVALHVQSASLGAATNDGDAHKGLAIFGRIDVDTITPGVGFAGTVSLLALEATGTFNVQYLIGSP